MQFSFLSGGTGTPKLLQGFRNFIDDRDIAVICNGGDDLNWYGLRVCPDLDTLLYMFAGKLDTEKFWGVRHDTFENIEVLSELGEDVWFNIGDRDLGLHVYRTEMMKKLSLTDITEKICKAWGIKSTILPMSNILVQSKIYSDKGELSFQEFFVKYRTNVEVIDVKFIGDTSTTTQKVLDTLISGPLIIGPSNPITSIGPILSITPIRQKMEDIRKNTIAISPIMGNNAFSGPTVKLMAAKGMDANVYSIAKYYNNVISKLVIDPVDVRYSKQIEDMDIEVIPLPINMKNEQQKIQLAKDIFNIL